MGDCEAMAFEEDKFSGEIDHKLGEVAKIESQLLGDAAAFRLASYNAGPKVHQKQMAFHKCPKRNRWVFGGNRTGKSECGAVEVVWMARGVHPFRANKPVEGWVVSLSFGVQRAVAQKKIMSYLPKAWIEEVRMREGKKGDSQSGIIDCIVVRNVFGSFSYIFFKSCEEGREKFQGASLDFVWFDEEPPEDVWRECCMRVLDKKGDIFATMTPLLGLTFVHDKIYLNPTGDPETWCEFISWRDNPFLPKSEVVRLSAQMDGEELLARSEGKFVTKLRGLVYPEFDPTVNVVEPFCVPIEWQAGIAIDPGLHNPLSCHFYAVDFDGNIFVVGEHYAAGLSIDQHVEKINELAQKLGWKRAKNGNLEAIMDSAGGQKTLSAPKSVGELFFERGISVNLKVNKDVFSGISAVRAKLIGQNGRPQLFVFAGCENMIREFKTYQWGNGDAPIKRDDHAMDELRYFVMSRPEAPKDERNWIGRGRNYVVLHKSKLMKRGGNI